MDCVWHANGERNDIKYAELRTVFFIPSRAHSFPQLLWFQWVGRHTDWRAVMIRRVDKRYKDMFLPQKWEFHLSICTQIRWKIKGQKPLKLIGYCFNGNAQHSLTGGGQMDTAFKFASYHLEAACRLLFDTHVSGMRPRSGNYLHCYFMTEGNKNKISKLFTPSYVCRYGYQCEHFQTH